MKKGSRFKAQGTNGTRRIQKVITESRQQLLGFNFLWSLRSARHCLRSGEAPQMRDFNPYKIPGSFQQGGAIAVSVAI
jgi:hypothetical protein